MRKNRADGIKKIVSYNIKLYWNWLYDRVSSMIENEGIFNGICLSFIAVVSGVIDLQTSVFAFQISIILFQIIISNCITDIWGFVMELRISVIF